VSNRIKVLKLESDLIEGFTAKVELRPEQNISDEFVSEVITKFEPPQTSEHQNV